MKHHQSNSDPLPYVQVDRAVKPKAALLAGLLGTTNQHALGSLVEWWDLSGDPRDLERIVAATPAGEEPKVVITAEVVTLRFRLASGHQVDPVALANLGLVESLGDGKFRVRGMSRFFGPVLARVRARKVAGAGGKARADGATRAGGRFTVAGGAAGDAAGVSAGADQPTTSRQPADGQPTTSGPPALAVSGQRSAVRRSPSENVGASAAETTGPFVAVAVAPPTTPEEAWVGEDFWRWAQDLRQRAGLVPERPPHPRRLGDWYSGALAALAGDVGRLKEAFRCFGDDPHWIAAKPPCPWNAFIAQWDRYVTVAPPAGHGHRAVINRIVDVAEEAHDAP